MPNPPFSIPPHILDVLRPELRAILEHSLSQKRLPRELFDEVSYRYFQTYVKPKLTVALANRTLVKRMWGKKLYLKPRMSIIVSPNYLVYRFISDIYNCGTTCKEVGFSVRIYLLGVGDDGRVFVNNIHSVPVPLAEGWTQLSENIDALVVEDVDVHKALGYDVDLGGREEATINLQGDFERYRIQGDLVLEVSRWIGVFPELKAEVLAYGERLLLDLINRILISHGLSTDLADNRSDLVLRNAITARNRRTYLLKVARLLEHSLSDVFGEGTVVLEEGERNMRLKVKAGEFEGCGVEVFDWMGWERRLTDPYLDIRVRVECYGLTPIVLNTYLDILEAFLDDTPGDFEFNIGNHHVRLHGAKSLSLMYKPRRQPLTLDEVVIRVAMPRTFLVSPQSRLELLHPEHGVKTVRFTDTYIVSFTHVDVANSFPSDRNRVILRNLKL
jgi:hypothetical protein